MESHFPMDHWTEASCGLLRLPIAFSVEVVLSQHCNAEGQLFSISFVYEMDSINICGNGAFTKGREICYVTWTFNTFLFK